MAIQVQIRRGTNKENNAFTGAQGEVTVNTINNSLRIHDGETIGGHIVLGESQITNCITEIPQDIKLELNNGTLTLKAGSKVYVPNGAGVFNTITIANDISVSGASTSPGTVRMLYYVGGNNIAVFVANSSGTTPPTSGTNQIFYNTSDNTIKRYTNGSVAASGYSLPLALIKDDGTYLHGSIDQVFNGFGYIGSTVFALPGVSGLTANGQNDDGTWRSSAFTLTSVKILNISSYTTIGCPLALNASDLTYQTSYFEQETNPGTNYSLWYNPKTNYLYRSVSTTSFNAINAAVIGTFDRTNGVVSNLRIKQTFHAVDYNDVVHTNSDQTINGTKTFTANIVVKRTSGQKLIVCKDTNNVDIGSLEAADNSNDNHTELFAFDENGSNSAQIGIHYNNGSPYGFAPTPASVYDNSTKIATTEHIIAVLDKIYPVGALYIGTTSTCPLAAFFGTWILIEYGDVLQTGNGTVGNWELVDSPNTGAYTVVAPGLPKISGQMTRIWSPGNPSANGTFSIADSDYVGAGAWDSNIYPHSYTLTFDASSSTSGSSLFRYTSDDTRANKVQPRAFVVNVWRRTA